MKVIRDGKVAVLVSPGHGAGWSTWASSPLDRWALYCPAIVAWVEAGKPGGEKGAEEIVKRELGEDTYFYCGGADQLCIEWVPEGTAFKIDEYDGYESLHTMGDIDWYIA